MSSHTPRRMARALAALAVALTIVMARPVAASADPPPAVDLPTPTTEAPPHDFGRVDTALRAGRRIRCGSAYTFAKFTASLGFTHIDVFRHANRTYACENGHVITAIFEGENSCSKYGWGVVYASRRHYTFGGRGSPVAVGTATCRMSVGGRFHGIGFTYNKQNNSQHTFLMRGHGAVVIKRRWTTTP
ncbi:MAG: hypothetical protein JWM05_2398 [Acidimicrobiales bacterium]|nr:hypothetical protein [Acidimicrobiales bacterium]